MLSKNDIKFIKSLQNKKFRRLYNAFTVEGEKNVLELLQTDWSLDRLLVSERFYKAHERHIGKRKYEIVSEEQLTSISALESNNAALAQLPLLQHDMATVKKSENMLVLCNVQDPGNLGTIMRTADWFGISQIICSETTVEWFNAKVVQSSMGAFSRVKIYYTNLENFLPTLTIPVLAADLDGTSLYTHEFAQANAIMMGSESHGIPESLKKFISHKLTIPAFGQSESLNVGIACGIFCYALKK